MASHVLTPLLCPILPLASPLPLPSWRAQLEPLSRLFQLSSLPVGIGAGQMELKAGPTQCQRLEQRISHLWCDSFGSVSNSSQLAPGPKM